MRQVREVLRLRTAGVGLNEIARRVGVAPSTVRLTLKRLGCAGLSWPLPAEMTDGALETALFAAAGTKLAFPPSGLSLSHAPAWLSNLTTPLRDTGEHVVRYR
jgi:transposase